MLDIVCCIGLKIFENVEFKMSDFDVAPWIQFKYDVYQTIKSKKNVKESLISLLE